MPSPILQFYFNRNCPYAQRSWLTLLELGIDFEPIEIELGKDNKTDWYRALNPNSTVPVIKQGETVVYESLVINEYLCEVFNNNSLMPSDPAVRARARILISRCDAKLVKLAYSYVSHKRQDDLGKDDKMRMQLEEELRFLDQAIEKSGGPYFMGEKVTLVDVAYLPFFERMIVALSTWKEFEIKGLNFPYLNALLEAMFKRESFLKTRTEPERIKEIYARFLGLDYFKKVGIAS